MPLQHKAQRLHLGAIAQPAVEPMRPIGRVRHLTLPQGHERVVQVAFIQPVGKATAGPATVQAEYQPGGFRGAAMLMRPQVEPPVITMYACALALHRIALGAPDQRAIGKQPHRPTRVPRHGRLHGVEQLFVRMLLTKVECRWI